MICSASSLVVLVDCYTCSVKAVAAATFSLQVAPASVGFSSPLSEQVVLLVTDVALPRHHLHSRLLFTVSAFVMLLAFDNVVKVWGVVDGVPRFHG